MRNLVFVSLVFWTSLAQASSKLFTGATIIAFDEETDSINVVRDGSLLITNDRIAAINDEAEPTNVPNDTERIDATGQIISPGFIDTHRHGWVTAWKTIAPNITLIEYFLRYREAAPQTGFTPEDVYIGQLAGLYETMNAGVTTTLDHAHHNWSPEAVYAGLNATIESGARVFWAYALHNTTDITDYTIEHQIPLFREIAESTIFDRSPAELAIAYDNWGPVVNPQEVQTVVDLIKEHKPAVLTTHATGGILFVDNMPKDVHAVGLLNTSMPVIFSHATSITPADVELLRSTNQYFSITPESEAHYGMGHDFAYINQDQAALGVDTHHTYSADILTQARLWLQEVRLYFFNKVLREWHAPTSNPMSVNQAFLLATRSGGLALRRPDLGVIQVGAKADIVVWDAANSPALLGWVDPVAAVLLHASVGDIKDVLVDGDFVKKDGKLIAEDYPQIRENFKASARRIQQAWAQVPSPQFSDGDEVLGIVFEEPRIADVRRGVGNGYGQQFLGVDNVS